MSGNVVFLSWLVVGLAFFSGCLAGAGEVSSTNDTVLGPNLVRVLKDPAADTGSWTPPSCPADGVLGTVLSVAAPPATEKAPPSLDALGVDFSETPELLMVDLWLGHVEEGFKDIVPPDNCGSRIVYSVCWIPRGPVLTDACAYVFITRENGVLVVDESVDTYCNHWWWCSWGVEFTAHPGDPGFIRWTIPRSVMPFAEAGGILQDAWFTIYQIPRFAAIDAADGAQMEPYVFESTMARPTVDGMGSFGFMDEAGDESRGPGTASESNPEADILGMHVRETATTLTLATKMAEVRTAPTAADSLYVALGLESFRVYEAGFDTTADGEREAWGGVCEDYSCEAWREFPVELTVTEGSPGWVNLTMDRKDLEPIQAGDFTNLLYADVFMRDRVPTEAPVLGPLPACGGPYPLTLFCPSVVTGSDWSNVAPPYWFRYDSTTE